MDNISVVSKYKVVIEYKCIFFAINNKSKMRL